MPNLGKATMTVLLTATGVIVAGLIMSQLRDLPVIGQAHAGFDS